MRYFTRARGGDVVAGPYDEQELRSLVAQARLSAADMVLLDEGFSTEQLEEYWSLTWQPIGSVVGFEKLVLPVLTETTLSPEASSRDSVSDELMWRGAAVFLLGLIVSVGSYAMASSNPNGGSYVVAYGAVISGAFAVIRGFLRSS